MTSEEMVALAAEHRDQWVEELRFRLIEAIYNDAHDWMGWSRTPDDITTEEYNKVCQMMEESVALTLFPVEDCV